MRVLRVAMALVALTVTLGAWVESSAAQSDAPQPRLFIDRVEARPGERVVVQLEGFRGRAATVSVCGNLALRGSGDCNMVASQGIGLEANGHTITEFVVSMPPVPCPCVLRAATTMQDQIATDELAITGAPTGPVTQLAGGSLVSVTVDARPARAGIIGTWRAALGGRTPYEVAISVENTSASALSDVALVGKVGRGADREFFAVPQPGPLAPAERKTALVRTTLPAPALGRFVWDVTAAGAGEPVAARAAVQRVPWLLVVFAAIFIVDVVAMVVRLIARRQRLRMRHPLPFWARKWLHSDHFLAQNEGVGRRR